MAKNYKNKNLGIIQIAASLVSLHYGLGFLLGTSEMVYKQGISGMVYGLTCGIGLLFLIFLIPFYWKNQKPIWDLLETKYGRKVKNGTIFLSWFWMIGVTTSQILGGAYIIKIFNISLINSLIIVIILTTILSLLPLEKLSKFLLFLLIVSSIVLAYGTIKTCSLPLIFQNLSTLPKSFDRNQIITFFGTAIPTILITMLGMDFHQFIVQGKKISTSITASVLAAIILFLLLLIPIGITLGSQFNKILPTNIDGKQIIPYTLIVLGKQLLGDNLGYLFLLSILIVSIGSCSCLVRIMTKTFMGFDFIPKRIHKKINIIIINSLIILILALKGGTMVSLIVSFYIVYISGVLVPFLAFLIQKKQKIVFHPANVFSSMVSGVLSSTIILIFVKSGLLTENISTHLEFAMITVGVVTSLITLIINKIITEPHFVNQINHYQSIQ